MHIFAVKYCFLEHSSFIVPRPNDFSILSDYFIQKALVKAFSNIRYEDGRVPNAAVQFLLNILAFNDNTCNMVIVFAWDQFSFSYAFCVVQ